MNVQKLALFLCQAAAFAAGFTAMLPFDRAEGIAFTKLPVLAGAACSILVTLILSSAARQYYARLLGVRSGETGT